MAKFMPSARETKFLQMVQQFPDAAMGHFSLGKLYLEESRYPEAVKSLEAAVKLDPSYAAAFVALGDALAGAGDAVRAVEVLERALQTPTAQRDLSLRTDVQRRLETLRKA